MMKKICAALKNKKNLPRLIVFILIILLFISVFFLVQYVQNLLYSDVQINLTEIVTQNKDVISSKLDVEVNNLEVAASQISDQLQKQPSTDAAAFEQVYSEYVTEKDDSRLFIAMPDGTAFFSSGESLNISGRRYFQLAMEGSVNVSDRFVSRLDGDERFVISVPILKGGVVIGTLQKFYSPEQMYALCSVSLFSSQGYMCIINSDGYILISSSQNQYSQEADNYYRFLYSEGNQQESQVLEADLKKGNAGFMETVINNVPTFSAYTPIEDIHDWYLITSVPTNAVSPNANVVIQMFYFILLIVVATFALFIFYFMHYKNKQQANLARIAFVDTVTQGNTYNKFSVDLDAALKEHPDKHFSLLAFDIDNFKYVNNFYGFDCGDRILYQINKIISQNLEPWETIARVSSDHFIVLLSDASEERINHLLALIENQEDLVIYVSGGVYTITNQEESVNLMVDKANAAAQSVKGIPHKRLEFYSETFDQQMIRNEQLKRSVELALANHEIIPFYQPKVDVNSGILVGAEALARWRTRDGKLVPPGEFIPVCEKTGLVTDVDMAIFEQTLHFLKRNLDAGIQCVPISVNFSRLHLTDPQFLNKVTDKIKKYGIPSHLLEVELTESVIFDNHDTIIDFITQLHENGLSISMDDFGSGYSSLNMLKDVPIDIIKIDREFLKKTANNERQRIIFSTIVRMAQQLHIKVVVEGVETIDNVNLMKEYDCSIAQGYYFAKPMDETEFEKIYREGKL